MCTAKIFFEKYNEFNKKPSRWQLKNHLEILPFIHIAANFTHIDYILFDSCRRKKIFSTTHVGYENKNKDWKQNIVWLLDYQHMA